MKRKLGSLGAFSFREAARRSGNRCNPAVRTLVQYCGGGVGDLLANSSQPKRIYIYRSEHSQDGKLRASSDDSFNINRSRFATDSVSFGRRAVMSFASYTPYIRTASELKASLAWSATRVPSRNMRLPCIPRIGYGLVSPLSMVATSIELNGQDLRRMPTTCTELVNVELSVCTATASLHARPHACKHRQLHNEVWPGPAE